MKLRIIDWVRFVSATTALAGVCAGQSVVPPATASSWKFTAGLGVVSQPKYPGSGESTRSALPLFSADYGRFFIGGAPGAGLPAGVGAYLVREGPWALGVGLGANFKKPRKESDDSHLRGLGDVDATEFGSLFGAFNTKWLSVRGSAATDIGGKHQGTRLGLDLEGRFSPFQGLMLSAGPGLTWADSQYTRTFFGVDAGQSARSGMAVYSAGSGINMLRFSVGANYQLTPEWGVGLRLSAASLRGDAAHSPITESSSQNTQVIYTSYRF